MGDTGIHAAGEGGMTDMVERVARAVCEEYCRGRDDYDRLAEHRKIGHHKRMFRTMARAAIAAMPLCDALAQIARGDPNGGSPLAGEKARQLARGAMIDLGLDW